MRVENAAAICSKGDVKMRLKLLATLLSLIVFIICTGSTSLAKSAKGPAFQQVSVPEGKAVVYFFRPKRFAMSATTIFMSIPTEADNCYAMYNKGYYAYVTDSGTLNILAAATGGQKEFSIELEPGDERFVQIKFGKWGPKPEFKELTADEAGKLIAKTRLIDICK
jgi:hypothetical protein